MNESPQLGPTGRPQLLASRCSTCLLRPGDPMNVGTPRVREVIALNREAGTLLTCHQTLSYGDHPEVGQAACRGYWDAYGEQTMVGRFVMATWGGFDEIEPPS